MTRLFRKPHLFTVFVENNKILLPYEATAKAKKGAVELMLSKMVRIAVFNRLIVGVSRLFFFGVKEMLPKYKIRNHHHNHLHHL